MDQIKGSRLTFYTGGSLATMFFQVMAAAHIVVEEKTFLKHCVAGVIPNSAPLP